MASETLSLTSWPRTLDEDHLDYLTLLATTYALSHGLLYLPPGAVQPPAPTSAIHAPLSLFPSAFPRNLFHTAQRIQHTYNVLYSRVAMDHAFLDKVMGAVEGVGAVDEFVGQLWRGWRSLRGNEPAQQLHLGLFRSDYLLHRPENDGDVTLKQVEFNTISSSFGTLSQRVAEMHRYLYASTSYYSTSLKPEDFPPNNTIAGLVEGIAAAHKAFNHPEAKVLFVTQAGERNVFDQRWLEYELLEKHGIHVVRQTFDELSQTATLLGISRTLRVATVPPSDISVVYFRAGYTPQDYPTPTHYTTRMLLERSSAIKCPSVPLQLAGGKKVQQVLAQPGVVERFLLDDTRGSERFTQADVDALRGTWVEMWALDEGADSGEGMRKARKRAQKLVLKPQREGGGNNVYKGAIPMFLDGLPKKERQAWIAMELIEPPLNLTNWLVRAGGAESGAVQSDVVSELGIYGWSLFGGGKVQEEKEAGWLLRTKGRESDEGGVAVGFSVLDSVLLVD